MLLEFDAVLNCIQYGISFKFPAVVFFLQKKGVTTLIFFKFWVNGKGIFTINEDSLKMTWV